MGQFGIVDFVGGMGWEGLKGGGAYMIPKIMFGCLILIEILFFTCYMLFPVVADT